MEGTGSRVWSLGFRASGFSGLGLGAWGGLNKLRVLFWSVSISRFLVHWGRSGSLHIIQVHIYIYRYTLV